MDFPQRVPKATLRGSAFGSTNQVKSLSVGEIPEDIVALFAAFVCTVHDLRQLLERRRLGGPAHGGFGIEEM